MTPGAEDEGAQDPGKPVRESREHRGGAARCDNPAGTWGTHGWPDKQPGCSEVLLFPVVVAVAVVVAMVVVMMAVQVVAAQVVAAVAALAVSQDRTGLPCHSCDQPSSQL